MSKSKSKSTTDQGTLTVAVPLAIRKRGGRKLVLSPAGEEITTLARPRIDNTLVKALARAFRWRKLLETGVYATVAEMADAEGINRSYVSRVLRLTLLAPEIVESILDGRMGMALVLPNLLENRPEIWAEQAPT
jgi:AraC-like DNA-binding protein